MLVLVACEFSGVVRDAFAARGHDAWSCDLIPALTPGKHYEGDVRKILDRPWDLIIAHPDCTYLTNAGVRWLDNPKPGRTPKPGVVTGPARWRKMWEACEFFRLFVNHPCPRICIENPIPHKYALRWIGRQYSQTVQPWQFGHGEVKRTCLWLKGLPNLQATDIVEGREGRVWRMPPSATRGRDRSVTYKGLGAAMATQWGEKLSVQ